MEQETLTEQASKKAIACALQRTMWLTAPDAAAFRAFAMGTHPRVGRDSPVRTLSPDAVRLIGLQLQPNASSCDWLVVGGYCFYETAESKYDRPTFKVWALPAFVSTPQSPQFPERLNSEAGADPAQIEYWIGALVSGEMTKSEAYTALGFDLPLAAGWLDEIVDFHELDKYCNWPKPCTVKSYQQIEQELEAGTYEYPAPAHIDFYRLYSRVMHQVQDLNQLWMEDAAADQAADRPVKWQEDGKNAPLFLLAYLLLSDSSKFCVRVPGGIKNAAAVFNSTVDVLQAGCNRQHRKVASFSWDDLKPDGRTNKWGGTSVGVGMHSDGVATNLLNVNHRWDYTMCASSTWFETGASEELPEQLTPPEFAQVLGSFAQQAVDTLVGGESAGPMSSREWGMGPTLQSGRVHLAVRLMSMECDSVTREMRLG